MNNHLWSMLTAAFLIVCFTAASCTPAPAPTPTPVVTPTLSPTPTPTQGGCPNPDAVVTLVYPTFSGTNPDLADRAENFAILVQFDQPIIVFDDSPNNWEVQVSRYVPYRETTLEKNHDLTAAADRLPATVQEVSQLGTHSIRIRSSLVEEHPLSVQEWLAGWYQGIFNGTFGNRRTGRMTTLSGSILGEVDLLKFEGKVCVSGNMQGTYTGDIDGPFNGWLYGIITYDNQFGYSGGIEGTLFSGIIRGEYQSGGQPEWHPITRANEDEPFDFKDRNGLPWDRFRGIVLGEFVGILRGEYDGLGYLNGRFDGTLDGEYDQDFFESGLTGTISCIDAQILGHVDGSFTGQAEGWYTAGTIDPQPFWGLICTEDSYDQYLAAANHGHNTYSSTTGEKYVDQVFWAYRGRTFALGDLDGSPCDDFCAFSGHECCIACVVCPPEPSVCPIGEVCP